MPQVYPRASAGPAQCRALPGRVAAVLADPARTRAVPDRPGEARHARLARAPRAQRQPHCPPFRVQPPDGVPLAGPLRPPPSRDPRGPAVAAHPTAPSDLDPWGARRGAPGAGAVPALGQGQAAGVAPARGDRALDLHGRTDPRSPARHGRAAGARPAPDQRPAARLAATARGAQARRLRRRAPGRPRPGRHPRRAAPAGSRAQAVHGPRRGVALGRARAADHAPAPAPRSPSSTPSRPGCRSGSGPSRSTTARSSWPSSSRRVPSATSPCSPCRPGAPSSTGASSGEPEPEVHVPNEYILLRGAESTAIVSIEDAKASAEAAAQAGWAGSRVFDPALSGQRSRR